MSVVIGAGSITQIGPIDSSPYGSIPANTAESVLKMGINTERAIFAVAAPQSVGQSITYLVEAAFRESDSALVVLLYYNAII